MYYSNDYSLEVRLQSEDRAHRIGQTSKVTYVDLMADHTIDEKIVKALNAKIDLASQVMEKTQRKYYSANALSSNTSSLITRSFISGMSDNIIVSSFNPFIIKKTKEIDDRFPTAWIWEKENLKFYNFYSIVLKYFKPNAIHIYHRIASQQTINKIHKKGMKVLAYTVNDKENLQRLVSNNIDGVFTDNPEILDLANQIVR